MKKNLLTILAIILITFFIGSFVFAQRELELQYPSLPKIGKIQATSTSEQFLAYVYHLLIAISGFVALGVIIYGGIIWLTSGGSPAKVAEARERILTGFVGLIILFGSYLILYTINPRLTILSVGIPEPKELEAKIAGVYLCNKECSKGNIKCIIDPANCLRFDGGKIPPEYQGKNLKAIHFLRPAGFPYFYLLLFDDRPGQVQRCGVMLAENYLNGSYQVGEVTKETATYITIGRFPGYQPVKGGVKFYERVKPEEKGEVWGPYAPVLGRKDMNPDLAISPMGKFGAISPVRAMTMEGEFAVTLFEKTAFAGRCYFASGNVPYLGAGFLVGYDENWSPYAQVGSLVIIPQGGQLEKPGIETKPGVSLSDLENRRILANSGIEVKSGVSLSGVRQDTIEAITAFKQEYKVPDGAMVITSGTEGHHLGGKYSHKNGYRLDLRLTSELEKIIESKLPRIDEKPGEFGGPVYRTQIKNQRVKKIEIVKEVNPPKDPRFKAAWARHFDFTVISI